MPNIELVDERYAAPEPSPLGIDWSEVVDMVDGTTDLTVTKSSAHTEAA